VDKSLTHSKNLKEFFHDKVKDVVEVQNVSISQEVEFYLVNILAHFSKSENLFHINKEGKVEYRPLALRLHDAVFASVPGRRFQHLKSLGDTALYYAGVFYDGLYNQVVDVGYYIGMGGSAYQSLANLTTSHGKTVSEMFYEMSQQFPSLVEILYLCCEREVAQTDIDLLKLLDRYLRTGSQKAKEILEDKGILPDLIKTDKTMQ